MRTRSGGRVGRPQLRYSVITQLLQSVVSCIRQSERKRILYKVDGQTHTLSSERTMSQIQIVVEIERPVEQVFDYLSDLRNMTDWAQGIAEVEQLTPQGVG